MKITNKKSWNLLLVFTLLLSLLTPTFALANEGSSEEGRTTGSLKITKLDESTVEKEDKQDGTGQITEVSGEGIPGVTYEVYQTHELLDIEYNEDGTVAYQEWKKLSNPIKVELEPDKDLITDEDGVIQLPDLPLGIYTVQETDAPDGYFVNPDVFEVEIPMTVNDGKDHLYDVHIYPKNEPNLGEVELEKVGVTNAGDEELLDRIIFQLFVFEKKDEDDEGEYVPYLTDEGEELKLTTENGKIGTDSLPAGKYYFQEIGKDFEGLKEDSEEYKNLDKFLLNNNKIKFEITKEKDEEGNEINVVKWEEEDGFVVLDEDGNVKVKNYERPEIEKDVEGVESIEIDREKEYVYNITITAPQDVQDYKVLGAWDKLDDRLTFVHGLDSETGEPLSSLGKDGWIVSSKDGYEVEQNDIEHGTESDGTLRWNVKKDVIKKLTPGQTITITFTAKINPDAELVEGEDGIPNQAEIEFDNDKGEENDPGDDPDVPPTPPVIVTPSEGGLKIIKVDKDDNSVLLPGAEFKLVHAEDVEELGIEAGDVVNAEGTIIKVNGESFDGLLEGLITDDNGEIHIEGLTPGNYELIETKAPTYEDEDGETHEYRLLTKPVSIEIRADQTDSLEVTVENSKSGWDLPGTGGIGTLIFTVIGITLMGGALLASRRRKEEQTA